MNRARSRFTVGSEIPVVCTDRLLMDILGIGHTAYCRRKKAGEFTPLLLKSPDGTVRVGATEYSGLLITRWLRGDLPAATHVRAFFKSINRGRRRSERARPLVSDGAHVVLE